MYRKLVCLIRSGRDNTCPFCRGELGENELMKVSFWALIDKNESSQEAKKFLSEAVDYISNIPGREDLKASLLSNAY